MIKLPPTDASAGDYVVVAEGAGAFIAEIDRVEGMNLIIFWGDSERNVGSGTFEETGVMIIPRRHLLAPIPNLSANILRRWRMCPVHYGH